MAAPSSEPSSLNDSAEEGLRYLNIKEDPTSPATDSSSLSKRKCKRLQQKQKRKEHMLFKTETIHSCRDATNMLVVGNGGLDCGVSREDLEKVFQPFGVILDIILLPKKPYSFVCYEKTDDAKRAYANVNHTKLVTQQNSVFILYLSYVNKVPSTPRPSSEWPPGLVLKEDVINEQFEELLMNLINWSLVEEKGTLKHRLVKHYGFEFRYGSNDVDPTKPLPEPIPNECQPLLQMMVDLGLVKEKPDQLTVNRYEPGQGIPPHLDTVSMFEDGIASLSLGSEVIMEFKHLDGREVPVLLPRRSLLVMNGEARTLWTHGISAKKSDLVYEQQGYRLQQRGIRVSFTFRKIASKKENQFQIPRNEKEASQMEEFHVHQVYEKIAEHFSNTRHTAWPAVRRFVEALSPGSLLIDVGCGNGKYLGINSTVLKIGCDRSMNLCSICQSRGHNVFVCDCLFIPLRDDTCDFAISIAVIHHMSTEERRLQAVKEIFRVLRPGGQALITVWAFEQERDRKSTYINRKTEQTAPSSQPDESISHIGIHQNRTPFQQQDVFVPWKDQRNPSGGGTAAATASSEGATATAPTSQEYFRFYHVFKEGELELVCQQICNLIVVQSFYEEGNWCVLLEKQS